MGNIFSREGLEETADSWLTDKEYWQLREFGMWLVSDKGAISGEPGKAIGMAGVDDAAGDDENALECFYFFSQACWGKGVAREVMDKVFGYVFNRKNIRSVDALIFAELNSGSVRLARKLGMQESGRQDILGHHLDARRMMQTIEFDIERIRRAQGESLDRELDHACFRIGQLLAEGIGERDTVSQLVHAAIARVADRERNLEKLQAAAEKRLDLGMEHRGMVVYRISREQYYASP